MTQRDSGRRTDMTSRHSVQSNEGQEQKLVAQAVAAPASWTDVEVTLSPLFPVGTVEEPPSSAKRRLQRASGAARPTKPQDDKAPIANAALQAVRVAPGSNAPRRTSSTAASSTESDRIHLRRTPYFNQWLKFQNAVF